MLSLLLAAGCHSPAVGPELEPLAAAEAGPSDPLPVLEAAAASLDVSARGRALGLLIRYEAAPGGGPWGPRALYDPHSYVQGVAVDVLASRIEEPESAHLLSALATREGVDPYVRGAAAFELALAGYELPPLDTEGLSYWQRAPLSLALAEAGDAEALADLERSLEIGEFPLELGFFEDLGRSGLVALIPSLTQTAGRVEPELVLPIGLALMELGSARGESLFREALSAPEAELRMEALDYLALSSSPASEALLSRARIQGPDAVRQYAQLIQLTRGRGRLDAVWSALDSPDRESRRLAVWALGIYLSERGDPQSWRRVERQAHAALRAALEDPELAVVMEGLQALALTAWEDDRGAVAGLLDQDPLVLRVEAAGALLAIADPS